MRTKDFLLALFLSLIITFVLICLYVFFPLISMLARQMSRGPETAGIAAVTGGISSTGLTALLLVEPIVFVVILALLNRRRTKE